MRTASAPHLHRICTACAPHVDYPSRTAASGKSSVRRPCCSSLTRSTSSSSSARRTGTCPRPSAPKALHAPLLRTLCPPPPRPPSRPPALRPPLQVLRTPPPSSPSGTVRGAGWAGTSGSSKRGPPARCRLARTRPGRSPLPRATTTPPPSPRPRPPRSHSPLPTSPPQPPRQPPLPPRRPALRTPPACGRSP